MSFPRITLSPLILLWAACAASAGALAEDLALSGAWVRALPPGQPMTAAYLDIENTGSVPVVVTGATVEGAGRAEIHATRMENGLTRMEHLTTLTVQPGQVVSLAPGDMHLMLFDLAGMPSPGERRRLCLQFGAGEELCTDAIVSKSAAASGHQHH
ncbi:copper chaperone PCu(A)C [Haliea sp. E17]|uniref:copper chaperone PCu(A)C n=1 Tax=Haliea sp. E17 TaxID=3401576 RepID=UPI003AB069F3